MEETAPRPGLEGVVVCDTRLSLIDGPAGRLVYCGHEIGDLAARCGFDEVCHLLWHDRLPTSAERDALRADLRAARALPSWVGDVIGRLPPETPPLAAVRTGLSALAGVAPDFTDLDDDGRVAVAVSLVARVAELVVAVAGRRRGEPLPPDRSESLPARLLFGLTGRVPPAEDVGVLDKILLLHAEHGLNASTFAARVTAATETDPHTALCAGLATLQGPLHGGANQHVMDMLEEIGSPDAVPAWLDARLAGKGRVMGYGHRAYRVLDPRARILESLCREVSERKGDATWLPISQAIREAMTRLRPRLHPNVDFYSAPTLHLLGVPRDLFPCVFAAARTAGWAAHVLEQRRDNRLISPRSRYVGRQPEG